MLLFDAHLDLALNAVDWNRDLRLSVTDLRVQETALGMTDLGRCTGTVSFPELRAAEIGVGVATVLARQEKEINHAFGCTTPEACYAMAHAHLAYYRAMERGGWVRMLRTRTDLRRHLADYRADPAKAPFGYHPEHGVRRRRPRSGRTSASGTATGCGRSGSRITGRTATAAAREARSASPSTPCRC